MLRSLRALIASSLLVTIACGGDILEPGWASDVPRSVSGFIRVVNASLFQLDEIYIVACDEPDFGPNLIPSDVVPPGEDIQFERDAGCYDVRVVTIDDESRDFRGVDLEVGRTTVVNAEF